MSLADARHAQPRSDLYRALERCDQLEAERDEARAACREWLGDQHRLMLAAALGLTRQQTAIMAVLWKQPVAPTNALVAALSETAVDQVGSDIVLKTQVCHMRSRLDASGGSRAFIVAHSGLGYSLSIEARAWISDRIKKLEESYVQSQA